MKKRFLFLLFLALCLSLAACDLPFDLPFLNQQEEEDYTALYALLESGDHSAAMNMLYELQRGNPPAVSGMVDETVVAKYAVLDGYLKQKDFASAAKYVAEYAFAQFVRLADGEAPAWSRFEAGWCEHISNVGFEKSAYLGFYKDGRFTCSRVQDDMLWIIREYTATQLDIEIYYADTLASAGYVRFNDYGTGGSGLHYFYEDQMGSSAELNYVRDWLLTGVYTDWQTPEQSEHFPAAIRIDGSEVVIGDSRYAFVRGEDGWMQILKEDGSVWYTAGLCMGEEYDFLELNNDWTRCTYYMPGADYDHAVMVYEYERALNVLSCLRNTSGGLDYNGDERSRQEWFDYIYNTMVASDGYGDSAKILANFTILEDLLVGVGTLEENTAYYKEYQYDSAGRLIFANDNDLTLYFYGTLELWVETDNEVIPWDTVAPHYYYEYDIQGRVSKIIHKDWNELFATITPVYNDQGDIKRMDILYASGETQSVTYTYDHDLMPFAVSDDLEEEGDEETWEDSMTDGDMLRSISFGEHFLEFSWTPDFSGYQFNGTIGWITVRNMDASYLDEYYYNEYGLLTGKRITVSMDSEPSNLGYTEEYVYTYDAQGRLTSEKVTTTDGDGNQWTVTYYYVYENVYFYDYDAA